MALKTKDYIVAGAIGLGISVFAGLAYLQFQKIKDYVIKLKGVKFNKISTNLLSFNLILDLTNKSSISITILDVITNVYVNDKFVVNINNAMPFNIEGNATSEVPININLNPGDLLNIIGINYISLLTATDKINIRAEIKMKAKLFKLIPISLPYTYQATLKELMTPTPVVSEQ